MSCMVQMEAQANPDELRLLLVQAEVELLGQEVQAYEVEASEVEKEEGTDKLSEKSESRELPLDRKKMMGQTKMSQHRQQTSGYKWGVSSYDPSKFQKNVISLIA